MPGTPNFGEMTPEEFIQWQKSTEKTPAPEDPYAATAAAWASNEFDFRLPTGALCRMRKMPLKDLATKGILDRVTRLPGLVDGVINKAENLPPAPEDEMPSSETIESMDEILNILVPLVVVQPKVWEMPNPFSPHESEREKIPGRIYPDSIELSDRIAIMERSLAGVKDLDNFRPGSE